MRVPRGEGDWVRGSRLPTVEIHFAPGGSTGGSTPGRLDQLHFHPLRDEFDLEKKKGVEKHFHYIGYLDRGRMRCNRILISRCKPFGEQSVNLGNSTVRPLSITR